jgi:hypothetical protein
MDGFATSSKEQLRSLVCVYELDEITPKGGKDQSVTKEHPRGSMHKRPNFMQGEPPSWTQGWHHQNGASRGGKVHKYMRNHGSEGATEPGSDGPGPLWGSVRFPFSYTRRSFNPKLLEVLPFARQRAILPRGHPQAREKRWEIVHEKDRSTWRKHPQVEKKEDTIGSITMINGAMSSTLMG